MPPMTDDESRCPALDDDGPDATGARCEKWAGHVDVAEAHDPNIPVRVHASYSAGRVWITPDQQEIHGRATPPPRPRFDDADLIAVTQRGPLVERESLLPAETRPDSFVRMPAVPPTAAEQLYAEPELRPEVDLRWAVDRRNRTVDGTARIAGGTLTISLLPTPDGWWPSATFEKNDVLHFPAMRGPGGTLPSLAEAKEAARTAIDPADLAEYDEEASRTDAVWARDVDPSTS